MVTGVRSHLPDAEVEMRFFYKFLTNIKEFRDSVAFSLLVAEIRGVKRLLWIEKVGFEKMHEVSCP